MPNRDPMEDLFRRSSENLEQRPSLRGWHQLEQRLEVNRQRSSRRRFNQGILQPWYYAAAAVVLVLIVVVGLGQTVRLDHQVLAKAPESIEELGATDQEMFVMSANYQTIPEGSRADVLTVKNSSLPMIMPAARYR